MGRSENNISNQIRLALSAMGVRLFRINTGRGWTGKKIIKLKNGDILIKEPRPFCTGTPSGYPDLSGWTQLKITNDHVGKTVCIFTAIEVKTQSGTITKDQKSFVKTVNDSGGISFIARSGDDAVEKIHNYYSA